jgi:2-polyprenyl-6-methoxyphenol hydroxylase-like FAD-dependent oxidoreductase
MNTSSIRDADVLIVGDGPTGLVLALWLTRLSVRVKIVDKPAEPGTTSRAVAAQARTLELDSQAGLADALVGCGWKTVAANLWVAGKNLSPFPFALKFPQDEHKRL